MADLDDLELNKSQEPPEASRRAGALRAVAIVGAAIAVAALGYYFFWLRGGTPPDDVRVQTEQAVPRESRGPEAIAGEDIELGPLDETDPIVRALVQRLSSHPKVAAWLATDQLIRNFTVVTVNIADGRTPAQHLRRIGPTGEFVTAGDDARLTIDPRAYRRYDEYADAVSGLDAAGTARLYVTLKPRIQDAYRELGYPEGDFDGAFEKAIVELLETPILDDDVRLVQKSVAYEYADPKLESLSPAQRQFLRMGPRNVRLIQAKLREIAPLVGIDPGSLPE